MMFSISMLSSLVIYAGCITVSVISGAIIGNKLGTEKEED